jgi:outer membrane protein TolC
VADAQIFLDITQRQVKGGEVAQSDVIKAELQVDQRPRDVQDSAVARLKSQFALLVLIFPVATDKFSVVDDLDVRSNLTQFSDVESEARIHPLDLEAAQATLRASKSDVAVARYGYLPSLSADFFYGINANQFATRMTYPIQATGLSTLPEYQVPYRQNLGYSAQITLNIPVWNWGLTQSRVRQAQYRRDQAQLDLTLTQKQFDSSVRSFYAEADVAQKQAGSLKQSLELAKESLRLTVLRYKAGEATTLEVVDAQTTAALARNAYADGLVRDKVALANLGLLTGRFQ